MKKITTLLLIVLFALPMFAKKVDVEQAKVIAKNIYYERINLVKAVDLSEINLTLAYTEVRNNLPVYYAFNVNGTQGFVIVSADDVARPVIGYSFESGFDMTNPAPAFRFWMSGYADQVQYARENSIKASDDIASEWAKYSNPAINKEIKATQPLLLHTWNQDWPYNELCPADAAGPGGHVYVGCVALAMGQIMKYYNYPDVGAGSHTNYSFYNGGYGNLTVNYASQTYDWYGMPNVVSGSNLEAAKVLYHISVSVNMSYSASGSGTQTSYIPEAIENHFLYDTDCQYVTKASYSTNDWSALLVSNIDNGWPMVYQGRETSGEGHAWNCDGYQGSEFHMNWGWGGSDNGYFSLTDLTAGGYNFNNDQGAVVNMYPPSTAYPEWCSSTPRMVTGVRGAFNDGSGNQQYQNNQDCQYLIQPACGSYVDLSFDRFELGAGDNVYIYDGTSTADPLLATYNTANLPGSTLTVGSGTALLIRFTTDGSGVGEGWDASYTTAPCKGTKSYTDATGTVSDGSQNCNYTNSLVCTFNLEAPGADSYNITFTQFSLAAGETGDVVKIYKDNTSSGNLIGTYNASTAPSGTINVNPATSNKVIVRWQTNSANNNAGWIFNYTAVVTGYNENFRQFNLSVYPNPFENDAKISFDLTENSKTEIVITNLLGQEVGVFNQELQAGHHDINISSFTSNLERGAYFVNLRFNDEASCIKLIKSN